MSNEQMNRSKDYLDEGHPLWCANEQIKDLLEGFGAKEDHQMVIQFFRETGLPEGTVERVHKAIVCAEKPEPLMELAREIRLVNALNGWDVTQTEEWADTYKVPAVLALIHSEVSEALEAFRKDDGENFVEELADVLIRVLDCVAAFEDDFDDVVRAKIEKNRTRGHRHGGKRV